VIVFVNALEMVWVVVTVVVGDELEELEKPTRVSASKSATTATMATSALEDMTTPLEEECNRIGSLFFIITLNSFLLY